MTTLDLEGVSNPVMVAARHHGISGEYAYLIADGLLARFGQGVWPQGHYWHDWAADEAQRVHGAAATAAFGQAMHDHQVRQGQIVTDGHDGPDNVVRAASITVAHCEHGSVFVRFHNRQGEIVAVATMDAEVAGDLVETLIDETEQAVGHIIAAAGEPEAGHVH